MNWLLIIISGVISTVIGGIIVYHYQLNYHNNDGDRVQVVAAVKPEIRENASEEKGGLHKVTGDDNKGVGSSVQVVIAAHSQENNDQLGKQTAAEEEATLQREIVQAQIDATDQWQPSPYCENILKECGGRLYGDVCIHVRYINQWSTCQGYCAEDVRGELARLGFDVNRGRMDSASGPPACVGYRPDLGGSLEGAKCLARLLGPQYKVGTCKSDGFPYNVRLH